LPQPSATATQPAPSVSAPGCAAPAPAPTPTPTSASLTDVGSTQPAGGAPSPLWSRPPSPSWTPPSAKPDPSAGGAAPGWLTGHQQCPQRAELPGGWTRGHPNPHPNPGASQVPAATQPPPPAPGAATSAAASSSTSTTAGQPSAGVLPVPRHGTLLGQIYDAPGVGTEAKQAAANAGTHAASAATQGLNAAVHGVPWWLQFPPSPEPLLPHVPAAILPYSWLGLAIAVALVLNGVFITYLVTLVGMFVRHKARPHGDSSRFGWHFLVPCRDEEAVIGGTIGYLMRHFPQAHVWVIDDDSEDATASIVKGYAEGNENIHLVARKRPDARTGKSEALNAAYRQMSAWLGPTADRAATIVAVVDADGRLAPGSLDVVAADHLFGNPATGAVQIEVRMINRQDPKPVPSGGVLRNLLGRVLIRLQDIEFRTVCSAVQMSRRVVHTVAMGGNGQFMRLTVLDEIGSLAQRPWRGSLQEDFEIGLHVLLTGSRTEYTPDTHVDQEALPDPGRLVIQRTRWSQGMMQCIRYLPELWRSRHLSASGVLELSYCLVQPWIQLCATLLYPLPWLALAVSYARHPGLAARFGTDGGWTLLGLYVVAALTQLAVWGVVYWRKCERQVGAARAVGLGVAFSLMVYISYLATWRAFFRIARRRNGWAKTRRNAEFTGTGSGTITPADLACDTSAA
jgi:cellulose synthase/poly-beta-1,6-N-acetylglucosamine synthase-like glycosyltransferase